MTREGILPVLALLVLISACTTPTPTPAPPATQAPAPTSTTVLPVEPNATPTVAETAADYTPTPEPEIYTPTWFDDAILYEIFVRSFYDSDGDGIGDLNGITVQLDYLEALGVTAIWLMPIHPSPSYHGYDVTDYYAINPDYGTMEDMLTLVDAAHDRNMRVIIDLVVNHMADDHPIFQDAFGDPDSDYADWFLWNNEAHTNYAAFGGFRDMPELNFNTPEVYEYVADIVRTWMDLDGDGDYSDGVDGFRCDVAKDVPLSTWQALRQEARALNPEIFFLGEVWVYKPQEMLKWFDDAFDALFDYPFHQTIADNPERSLDGLLAGTTPPILLSPNIIREQQLFPAGYQMVRFLNNHDNNRAMSEVGMDWDRAKTAATLLLTLPDTPMIYYGEEIGMLGEKGSGNPYWDEYRREPMDWYANERGEGMTDWFKPSNRYNAADDGISVEEQEQAADSLLTHYRSLTALRHAHPALRQGAFAKVNSTNRQGIYAFTRHSLPRVDSAEEWFLVIINFSDETQSSGLKLNLAYPGPFAVVDALSGAEWPDWPVDENPYEVELPAASSVVLQLSQP